LTSATRRLETAPCEDTLRRDRDTPPDSATIACRWCQADIPWNDLRQHVVGWVWTVRLPSGSTHYVEDGVDRAYCGQRVPDDGTAVLDRPTCRTCVRIERADARRFLQRRLFVPEV